MIVKTALAWEADRKQQVAAGRLAPASAGRITLAEGFCCVDGSPGAGEGGGM